MPSIIIPLTESTPKCVPEEHYNVTTGHIKGIRALRAKKIKTEIKALVLTTNSALCVSYQVDHLTTKCRDTSPEAMSFESGRCSTRSNRPHD